MSEDVIHGKAKFAAPLPANPIPNAMGRYFSKYKHVTTIAAAYTRPEPKPITGSKEYTIYSLELKLNVSDNTLLNGSGRVQVAIPEKSMCCDFLSVTVLNWQYILSYSEP